MIYFDNASTSYPKAPPVADKMADVIKHGAFNPGRGSYFESLDLMSEILDCRIKLSEYFAAGDPRRVIFKNNVTEALNWVLKGLLKEGDTVVTSSFEHNAVMRPLRQLEKERNIKIKICPFNADLRPDLEALNELIDDQTRAVVMTAASNVTGVVYPIKEIARICEEKSVYYILDSAQMAGILPIKMNEIPISALCFTGHKGLRGPQGSGGIIAREEFYKELNPLMSGGTGSFSDSEELPPLLPDRFEPGTMNVPGILGLYAAISYISEFDEYENYLAEMKIAHAFIKGLEEIIKAEDLEDKVKICAQSSKRVEKSMADPENADCLALVSVDFTRVIDNAEMAYELEEEAQILTRTGLHCAPRAHKSMGTFPQGTVRFCFSSENTLAEVDTALNLIKKILVSRKAKG